jgi:hypothetical protein
MNKITLSLLAILIFAQVSAESILDIGDKIRKYRQLILMLLSNNWMIMLVRW